MSKEQANYRVVRELLSFATATEGDLNALSNEDVNERLQSQGIDPQKLAQATQRKLKMLRNEIAAERTWSRLRSSRDWIVPERQSTIWRLRPGPKTRSVRRIKQCSSATPNQTSKKMEPRIDWAHKKALAVLEELEVANASGYFNIEQDLHEARSRSEGRAHGSASLRSAHPT